MKKKLKIGVLFGGKSAEHEASLQTAQFVIGMLDKNKYEVAPIGITKTGKWLLSDTSNYLLHANNPKLIKLNKSNQEVVLSAEGSNSLINISKCYINYYFLYTQFYLLYLVSGHFCQVNI